MNRDSDSPENQNPDGAASEPTSQPAPEEHSDASPVDLSAPADTPAPEPASEPGESVTSAGATAEPPEGLQPSPGLQPPSGIYAPPPTAASQPPEMPAPQQPEAWQQSQQQYAQDQHYTQPYAQDQQQYQPETAQYQPGEHPADPNAYPPQDPQQQAQWAGQGAAYPQQQYAQPGVPGAGDGQPPKKGLSKGALWGIIGGGAGLLVIVLILVLVFAFSGNKGGGGLGLLGSESPSESVENYLNALADGDAKTAAGYLDTYGDTSMLTDKVLEKSNELAPIADVVIGESQETAADQHTVEASFTLGGETIERTFEVWTIGETTIYDGAMSFSGANFDGLGLTLNGAELKGDSVHVFPGAYELDLEVEEFEVKDQAEPLVLAVESDRDKIYQLEPTLTAEATQTFRDLVTASLNDCIASKALTTDCGMDVSSFDQDGYSAVDGTVTRSLTAEGTSALKNLTVSPSYEVPTLVTSNDYIAVDMTLEAENSSGRAQFELLWGGDLGKPSVDFADENPTVRWD